MRATAAADEIYFIRYGSNVRGQGWFSIDGQFKGSHALGFFRNQHINKKHFIK